MKNIMRIGVTPASASIVCSLAALASLMSATSQAREPEPDVAGFKAYELPTYTIVTHDERNARPIPRLAAQTETALDALFGRTTRAPSSPTYILLMPESVWLRYLRPGQGIVGEFVPGRFANYVMLNNARDVSSLGRGVFHEYSHWYLHSQFAGVLPLWFDEGLAEFVKTAEFRDNDVTMGYPELYGPVGWMPLEKLFRLTRSSPEYRGAHTSPAVHRESWAIVHRAFVGDAQFKQQVFAYLDALNAQKEIDEAARASFGTPIDELDRKIYAYLNPNVTYLTKHGFQVLRLPVERTTDQRLPSGRSMDEVEALQLVADVMLASGFNAERLPEVAAAIRRVAPDSAADVVLRMRLAARSGDDATVAQLVKRFASKSIDPALLRGAGLAIQELVERSGHAALAPAGLEMLDRAAMSRPDDAEAIWAYAMLSARLQSDVPIALRRVLEMRILYPANPYLAQAVALLHESRGDAAAFEAALRDTLKLAKDPSLSEWAKTRRDELASR